MDDGLDLLRLQIEWGADEALDPAPLDRLATPVAPAPTGRPRPLPQVRAPDQPRVAPADRAAALAGQAATLEDVRTALGNFDGCALRATASNLVFAEGDPASTTLIIGEPPGRDEDRSGHPFTGADGVLLDQMLGSIGLRRGDVMLVPLLPWRPPGGRPPNAAEVTACLPFLHRLIVLLNPRRLVLFGPSAARALLPPNLARRRQAPDWLSCTIPGGPQALPTLNLPSLAESQKTPALRRVVWAGLRRLRRAIDSELTGT